MPRKSSSCAMRIETAGWEVLSFSAARRKLRRLATHMKVSRLLKSITAAPASDKISLSEIIEKHDWTRSRVGPENLAPHQLEIPTMEKQLSEYKYVYYASYGSNLDRARFMVYLRGGSPYGSERMYPRNRGGAEPPTDDVCFTSEDWTVTFAGRSQAWLWDPRDPESGGGMAFLVRREGISPAPCAVRFRAYLITLGQFVEVVCLENTRRED